MSSWLLLKPGIQSQLHHTLVCLKFLRQMFIFTLSGVLEILVKDIYFYKLLIFSPLPTRCKSLLISLQAFLVTRPLNLNLYQAVLLYWRSRFLDTASQGLLSVLGLITVKDLVYYLQFYSVPIVTVIISPVVKLCCACLTVYGQGKYFRIQA